MPIFNKNPPDANKKPSKKKKKRRRKVRRVGYTGMTSSFGGMPSNIMSNNSSYIPGPHIHNSAPPLRTPKPLVYSHAEHLRRPKEAKIKREVKMEPKREPIKEESEPESSMSEAEEEEPKEVPSKIVKDPSIDLGKLTLEKIDDTFFRAEEAKAERFRVQTEALLILGRLQFDEKEMREAMHRADTFDLFTLQDIQMRCGHLADRAQQFFDICQKHNLDTLAGGFNDILHDYLVHHERAKDFETNFPFKAFIEKEEIEFKDAFKPYRASSVKDDYTLDEESTNWDQTDDDATPEKMDLSVIEVKGTGPMGAFRVKAPSFKDTLSDESLRDTKVPPEYKEPVREDSIVMKFKEAAFAPFTAVDSSSSDWSRSSAPLRPVLRGPSLIEEKKVEKFEPKVEKFEPPEEKYKPRGLDLADPRKSMGPMELKAYTAYLDRERVRHHDRKSMSEESFASTHGPEMHFHDFKDSFLSSGSGIHMPHIMAAARKFQRTPFMNH